MKNHSTSLYFFLSIVTFLQVFLALNAHADRINDRLVMVHSYCNTGETCIAEHVRALSDYGPRLHNECGHREGMARCKRLGCTTPGQLSNLQLAENYLVDQLKVFGYQTETESVRYKDDFVGNNIIATKIGTVYPKTFIEFGAHYDSSYSPGGDDNASGCAAVLEIARVLANYQSRHSMRFIFFAAEEQDKDAPGSITHVNNALAFGETIRAALVLDTIGQPIMNGSLFQSYVSTMWYRGSRALGLTYLFAAVSSRYSLGVRVIPENIGEVEQSDERSYWLAYPPIPSVTTLADWRNSDFHACNDRIDDAANVDIESATRLTKLNLAVGMILDARDPENIANFIASLPSIMY